MRIICDVVLVSTESSWDLGKRIRDWLALNPPGISEKGSDLN